MVKVGDVVVMGDLLDGWSGGQSKLEGEVSAVVARGTATIVTVYWPKLDEHRLYRLLGHGGGKRDLPILRRLTPREIDEVANGR